MLLAAYVCIIAVRAIAVNQNIVGFLQQNLGILGKKIRKILLFLRNKIPRLNVPNFLESFFQSGLLPILNHAVNHCLGDYFA